MDPLQRVESIARDSYGRLLAYLSVWSRDVVGVEDALSEVLYVALVTWPRNGVPRNPEAWLLAVARRRMIDATRHATVRAKAAPALQVLAETEVSAEPGMFPDDRLKLLFICAHPAINAAVRTPLMLQTVLGIDAARIASAFLVNPAAMSQRLVRAKTKIRAAGIAFEVPAAAELPGRLDAVLEAIYAAYGTGWDDAFAIDAGRRGLATEAVWLARVLVHLLPASAEALGLLSLMLHCEARRAARRSPEGDYVPLSDQDTARWSRPMLEEAEQVLRKAATLNNPGRFQLEAAIQSAHAQRIHGTPVDWNAILALYDALAALAPRLGVWVGRAAALGEALGTEPALVALDELPAASVAQYQPYWALLMHLHERLGDRAAAATARQRALGLTKDPAVRRFLQR
ncbi:MAG TPA: DUF6596 domain-containing protein [Opitutaceae bacterium]